MNAASRARLELVRPPNLITAAADVAAGFLFVGGSVTDWPKLLLLAIASICLYGGGVALNDVCDAAADARDRPERPIPSGRISRNAALRFSVALLILGWAMAATVSPRSAVVAGILVAAIVLYDTAAKRMFLAPPLMGACRALNLALGMTTAPTLLALPTAAPMAILWLYVGALTVFARQEVRGGGRPRLIGGAIGMGLAVAGLGVLPWVIPDVHPGYGAVALVPLILVVFHSLRAACDPRPAIVQRSVGTLVLAILLLDVCLILIARGPVISTVACALLIPPALLLRRRFPVT